MYMYIQFCTCTANYTVLFLVKMFNVFEFTAIYVVDLVCIITKITRKTMNNTLIYIALIV